MTGFLLDENVPGNLRFKPSLPVFTAASVGASASDSTLWEFAVRQRLAIVSKDADFSERIILREPPPWVVHLRFGNLRRADYHAILARAWPHIETLLLTHKLVNVYEDRIEGIH